MQGAGAGDSTYSLHGPCHSPLQDSSGLGRQVVRLGLRACCCCVRACGRPTGARRRGCLAPPLRPGRRRARARAPTARRRRQEQCEQPTAARRQGAQQPQAPAASQGRRGERQGASGGAARARVLVGALGACAGRPRRQHAAPLLLTPRAHGKRRSAPGAGSQQ